MYWLILWGWVGIVHQTIQSGKSVYVFGGINAFQITGQLSLEKLNKISSIIDAENIFSAMKSAKGEFELTTPTAPVITAGVQTEGVIMIIPFSNSTKSIPLNASTGDSPPDATRVMLEIDPKDPQENWLLEHEDEIKN